MKGKDKPRQALFLTLSVLGVLLILFFGMRAVRSFKKFDRHGPPPFSDELQTDVEAIEEWMTIPFISHNYGVPPEILFEALGIEPKDKGNFKKSLKQLNEEYFPETDGYVLETIKTAVLANLPPSQPGTPALPPTP